MSVAINFKTKEHARAFISMLFGIGYKSYFKAVNSGDYPILGIRLDTLSREIIGYSSAGTYDVEDDFHIINQVINLTQLGDEPLYFNCGTYQNALELAKFAEAVGFDIHVNHSESIIALYVNTYNILTVNSFREISTDISVIFGKQENQKVSKESNKEYFTVKVSIPELSEAIQKVAFRNGFVWCDETDKVDMIKEVGLVFSTDGKFHYDSNLGCYDFDAATQFSEIVAHFESLRITPISIGGYNVEFKEGGIQVGCTFVDGETVEEIYRKFQNKNMNTSKS